jgi:hypothetical protein
MWEHVSLTFGREDLESGKRKPFRTASQEQMEAVRDLQRAGFECVSVTTLHDGCLFLMFKRHAEPDSEPTKLKDRYGVEVGLYG